MKTTILFLSFIFVSFSASAQADQLDKIRAAAEQGNPAAQLNMAVRYYKGVSVEKNHDTAQKYFELAARKGSPIAKIYLADMYSKQAQYQEAFFLLKDIRVENKSEVADEIWNEHELWKYSR